VVYQRQRGYSLTEVLLVLAVLGIALAVTLPAMSQFMRSYSAKVSADEFVAHLRLARHLSIARHTPVSFTVNANSYSLPDWASADLATAPQRSYNLAGTVAVVSGTGTVTFQPNGTVSAGSGTIRLEIDLDGQWTGRYDVQVSAAGKVSATYTKVSS
jgi:prepilin-type N-terminal cleavage/methylation domain-containing protein